MTRYAIRETAVYTQVRTVVWEDGAVMPLLPDFSGLGRWVAGLVLARDPRAVMKRALKPGCV